MFRFGLFLKKSYFFLVSLGLHIFIFVLFYSLNPIEKSEFSVVDIDIWNNSLKDSVQNSSHKTSIPKKVKNLPSELVKSNLISREDTLEKIMEKNEASSDLAFEESYHQNYLDKVRSKIEFHKTYPKTAKVFKESGLVKVKIQLLKSGHLQKIEIAESSLFNRLDEAAIKSVADAAPFDEFPSEVKFATWSIIIPIRFELKN